MTDTMLLYALGGLCVVSLLLNLTIVLKVAQLSGRPSASRDDVAQVTRIETEMLRSASDEQSRGLRHEVSEQIAAMQGSTITAITNLSEGVASRIRDFGENLKAGVEGVERNVLMLSEKLNQDVDRISVEANQGREALRALVEDKLDTASASLSEQTKVLREELGSSFHRLGGNINQTLTDLGNQQKERLESTTGALTLLTEKNEKSQEALKQAVESRLDAASAGLSEETKALREELGSSFHRLGGNINQTLTDLGNQQKERLDATTGALTLLTEKNEKSQDALKQAVESRLDAIRVESATKLDEMRQTVDEKLQSTLETRLGESFNRVVEQLNRVHEGLGEMKSLASNVGDLKSVLTNVKVRGTFGEVQLELILEQFLTPDQYIKNAKVKENTGEVVEFAIKLPGKGIGDEVLLPIDAKFPRETYDRLLEASEAGDEDQVKSLRKQLEAQVRNCAKEICTKYINSPRTTEFALLFLPTEGLYAEVLRQVGLFESLQRDFKVTLAGPTTLSAILNALQMGFRSLAIEKRSSEVWQVLGAVQQEFKKYNDVVDKLGNQLSTAARSVENLGTRTKQMSRKLKSVEALPVGASSSTILGLEDDEALPVAALQQRGKGASIVLPLASDNE